MTAVDRQAEGRRFHDGKGQSLLKPLADKMDMLCAMCMLLFSDRLWTGYVARDCRPLRIRVMQATQTMSPLWPEVRDSYEAKVWAEGAMTKDHRGRLVEISERGDDIH